MLYYFQLLQASDEKLAKWGSRGNKRAVSILLKRYLARLHDLLHYYLRNSADEDEVLQNVLMEATRELFKHHYIEMHNFFGWLNKIAYHEVMDFFRRRDVKKKIIHDGSDLTMNALESDMKADHIVKKNEVRAMVKTMIDSMPKKSRDYMRMFYIEDLTYKEIAAIMNCTEKAVAARLHRGRMWLVKKYGKK